MGHDNYTTAAVTSGPTVSRLTVSSTTIEDEMTDCEAAQFLLNVFPKFMFGYSVLLIFGLGFVVTRKKLCLKCCWGRPGAVQPVDFIDEIGRRWAYGACFVILTADVGELFIGDSFWDIQIPGDEAWKKKFDWVKVFTKLLDALSICLLYYPLLACVDHRRSIPANVLGFTKVVPWIFFYCVYFDACSLSDPEGGDGLNLFVFRIPIFISFLVVGFSYVLDFSINIHRWRKQRAAKVSGNITDAVTKEHRGYKMKHHFEYCGTVMQRKETKDVEEGSAVKVKLKQLVKKMKYEKILGFKYSTRLVCCITICTTVLIWFVVKMIYIIDLLLVFCEAICDALQSKFSGIEFIGLICDGLRVVKIVAHFSSAFSALVVFIMLFNTLITYKRRWHQLLRGDHSWHNLGDTIASPTSTLLNGLKYAGYQVAFVIWGWFVMTVVVFVVLMFVSFAFIIPLRDKVRNWLIQKLIDLWPTLLLGIIVIPLVQRFICKFLFLQNSGNVLALTNRRIYNATSYYFLVLNIIVGMFSCLKRILIPLVLGIAFLSRLDQPLIMSGFESKDPGYVAFVSMLLVDLYHNHPLVKTFVELLYQVRNRHSLDNELNDAESIELHEKRIRSKRIRNRWLKTITLVNNPSLVLKALEQRLINERDQLAKQIPQDAEGSEEGSSKETDSLRKENMDFETMQNGAETKANEKFVLSPPQDDYRNSFGSHSTQNTVC